jgi:shikimate dehydrogenase
MHDAAFRHFGVKARYELRDLEADGLSAFVEEARGEEWLGFQVTAPYKQAVMPHLDEIEADAVAIGAVNSVLRRADGALIGFNTDAGGFRRAAETELGGPIRGVEAVVAGAGGAARAVVHALVSAGAARVSIGNRTAAHARDLAADHGDGVCGMGVGAEFAEAARGAGLAVNATTVGMLSPGVAFDVSALPGSAVVLDLVYVPPDSELIRLARARGLRAANGLGMLVAQAEMAFERWTGIPHAGPVMRAALDESGVLDQAGA